MVTNSAYHRPPQSAPRLAHCKLTGSIKHGSLQLAAKFGWPPGRDR